MGIFTDLAIGGITQFDETARRDTEKNTTMANIALEKSPIGLILNASKLFDTIFLT